MRRAELAGQRSRGVVRAPIADADAGARRGEGDGDRLPNPRARSGDDGAQTGERRPPGLRYRRRLVSRGYPSAPPAKG